MNNFLTKLRKLDSKYLEQGFSMAEVMVATAILGIVVVAAVSQLNLSSKSATDMASDAEINNFTNKIISSIGTPAICAENFRNRQQTANYSVLTSSGAEIARINTSIGTSGGEIKIGTIDTKKISDNEMLLVLSFQKKKFGLGEYFASGPKREIPINTGLKSDGSGQIEFCFANYDLVIKTAIQQSCKGSSSFYNAEANLPYGQCEHNYALDPTPSPEVPEGFKCTVPGEFLKTVKGENGKTVYTCGKIFEGCDPGKGVVGFNADGTVICEYVLKTCDPGQIIVKDSAGRHVCTTIDCSTQPVLSAFAGFNPDGSAVCKPISNTNNCPANQYAQSITSAGTIVCNSAYFQGGTCTRVNQFITGFNSAGLPICADFVTLPASCPSGQAIVGIRADGSLDCRTIDRPLGCGGAASHTYQQCKAAGATVMNAGTSSSHCLFSGAACPGGWQRCQNFGSQRQNSCTDTSNTTYCNSHRVTRVAYAPGGDDVYGNNPLATERCIQWTGADGNGRVCSAVYHGSTTFTLQTQVGCY